MNTYSTIQKSNITMLQTFNVAHEYIVAMKDDEKVSFKTLLSLVSSRTGASKSSYDDAPSNENAL